MKIAIVVCALVAVATAKPSPRKHECVAPRVWEANTYAYDHRTSYYALGRMAYDAEGKKVRFVERVDENNTRNAYDSLYLFDKKAEYRIDQRTRKCSKEPLNRPFVPVEVHENSTYVGDAILGSLDFPGSGVIVQTWTHQSENASGIQVFTTNGCLPVEHEYRGKDHDGQYIHYHFSYFDISPGVSSPEIFDVPKECL